MSNEPSVRWVLWNQDPHVIIARYNDDYELWKESSSNTAPGILRVNVKDLQLAVAKVKDPATGRDIYSVFGCWREDIGYLSNGEYFLSQKSDVIRHFARRFLRGHDPIDTDRYDNKYENEEARTTNPFSRENYLKVKKVNAP